MYAELVRVEENLSGHFYHLTDQGEETLRFFKDKISDAIISDINEYMEENKLSIINNASILTEYYKSTGVGYDVNLRIREKDRVIFELTVNVDEKIDAEGACRNFKEKSQIIYEAVMRNLMSF